MPIEFPRPPAEIDRIARTRRAGRRRSPLRLLRELGGAAPPRRGLPAQPVFTLGLEDVLGAGKADESVRRAPRWRYSRVHEHDGPEVLELGGGEGRAAQVVSGDDRFGPLIREALAAAGEDPRTREHDYQARLLRVPALSLLALWLHAEPATDLFVPLGRSVPGLEPHHVYEDEAFMSALRERAAHTLETFRTAERPDELGS